MTPELLWTEPAVEDMRVLYRHIAGQNGKAADRLYSTIVKSANLLLHYPRLGVRRTDLDPSARVLLEGNYRLLYRTYPDTDNGPIDAVEIIRVVHVRRDLRQVFRPA